MENTFSIKKTIESSPALKSNTLDYDDHWTLDSILNIYGNLTVEDLARITSHNKEIVLVLS